MTRVFMSWQCLMVGCVVLLMAAATGVRADDEGDKKKGQGKDEKPNVIQIDLSKLPPDLAKVLQKYATDSKKPAKGPKADKKPDKGPKADKKPDKAMSLPPGLAKKAPDHPGRVAWLKAHGASEPKAPKKGAKGKGKDKDDDDD